MARSKGNENPEGLQNVKALEVSEELVEFVKQLDKDVQEARTDRSDWETRQDVYMRKRYAIRNPKTFPWPGCANFVLPQIDSDINRLKPAYVNLAYGVSPIVLFEPYGPEDIEPAKKREALFDWRMKTQVKFFKDYCLGIDYMLQRGFTLYKITWKFTTRKYTKVVDLQELESEVVDALLMPEMDDATLYQIFAEELKPDMTFDENVEALQGAVEEFREGKTRFEFEFIEKAENRADVRACDPRDEVAFPPGTTDIQQAYFIDYRFWVSKNELKQDMVDEKYTEKSDDTIDGWSSKSYKNGMASQLRATRDGYTMQKRVDEMILMHEVCTWFDVNGDGIDERVIVTYPDSDPSAILRFIEVPYDHGLFPYAVVRRELNDAEIISSRGIPALDDDFQTGISVLFNQDIDAGTIATTPTVVSRKNSVKNLRNLRYVPGQQIETENGQADYTILQNQNLGQTNRFNNMTYLKSWANDRIGNVTSAFSQINNTSGSGRGGSKSATESAEIAAAAGQLQSMDLMVFQQQMADVYYQIDMIYEQFGDEDEEILITGEKPMRISREEIQGQFNRVPNGRLDNSNPVLRSNKMLAVYDRFSQNPYVDSYELTKVTLNELDLKLAKTILKPAERVAQEQQAAAMQKERMKGEMVQMRRVSNALDVEKEAQLAVVQGKKYAKD